MANVDPGKKYISGDQIPNPTPTKILKKSNPGKKSERF